ncbi:MAG: glycyl-radical enzyme activating protein [Anaerolineae bacterium]
MISGQIFDIKKYSLHDGPGIRTTLFLKGCPLNCWWCHNPESQSSRQEMLYRQDRCLRCGACVIACEQGAISQVGDQTLTDDSRCTRCGACVEVCYAEARQIVGREMTVPQVMAELERDIPFYDESGGGVTFSGGEPLMQPGFLLALLQACKKAEYHTVLDTCGLAPWQTLDPVRQYVDLFLYDLKLMDNARHRQFTGVSNETILANLEALSREGHNIILRVPIVPGVNDDQESLRQIAEFAITLPHLAGVDLLPFHAIASAKYDRLGREYELRDAHPPSPSELDQLAELMRGFGFPVKIGG